MMNRIPDEILLKILANLTFNELLAFSVTDKNNARIAGDRTLWCQSLLFHPTDANHKSSYAVRNQVLFKSIIEKINKIRPSSSDIERMACKGDILVALVGSPERTESMTTLAGKTAKRSDLEDYCVMSGGKNYAVVDLSQDSKLEYPENDNRFNAVLPNADIFIICASNTLDFIRQSSRLLNHPSANGDALIVVVENKNFFNPIKTQLPMVALQEGDDSPHFFARLYELVKKEMAKPDAPSRKSRCTIS